MEEYVIEIIEAMEWELSDCTLRQAIVDRGEIMMGSGDYTIEVTVSGDKFVFKKVNRI